MKSSPRCLLGLVLTNSRHTVLQFQSDGLTSQILFETLSFEWDPIGPEFLQVGPRLTPCRGVSHALPHCKDARALLEYRTSCRAPFGLGSTAAGHLHEGRGRGDRSALPPSGPPSPGRGSSTSSYLSRAPMRRMVWRSSSFGQVLLANSISLSPCSDGLEPQAPNPDC